MSMTEVLGPKSGTAQRQLPIEVSARCTLVGLDFVRNQRGCDAESVLNCVGNATHPRFLRWVFNLAVNAEDARRRELRFWKDEILLEGRCDKWCEPAQAVEKILGSRRTFPRGEIEVAWTLHAATISRLIRAGEITEINRQLTRPSLAAFLTRRLDQGPL